MRISDWSSDVCSSDLRLHRDVRVRAFVAARRAGPAVGDHLSRLVDIRLEILGAARLALAAGGQAEPEQQDSGMSQIHSPARKWKGEYSRRDLGRKANRSEEHTSELRSLMRLSYDVFCLNNTKKTTTKTTTYKKI